MSVLLITIATGRKYWEYAHEMLASAAVYFPKATTLAFTDAPQYLGAISRVSFTEAKGYPNETLYRYHTFLKRQYLLEEYDYVFFADADMRFVAPVEPEDIISDGITATLHPGFVVPRTEHDGSSVMSCGTPERMNKESKAHIPWGANNRYFCGGFNGGTTEAFLKMASTIQDYVDYDKLKFGPGYMPIWHDESYLNRYLYDNPPARILTPSFCYPQNYDGGYGWSSKEHPPVLIAINKKGERT